MKFVLLVVVLFPGCFGDDFKCPSDGLFPHPKRCDLFYNCGNKIPTEQHCPKDLVFNEEKKECDYLKNVPHCTKETVEEVIYRRCHPMGYKGCTTYPGPNDVKCCGANACYNLGGSGGSNECVPARKA